MINLPQWSTNPCQYTDCQLFPGSDDFRHLWTFLHLFQCLSFFACYSDLKQNVNIFLIISALWNWPFTECSGNNFVQIFVNDFQKQMWAQAGLRKPWIWAAVIIYNEFCFLFEVTGNLSLFTVFYICIFFLLWFKFSFFLPQHKCKINCVVYVLHAGLWPWQIQIYFFFWENILWTNP